MCFFLIEDITVIINNKAIMQAIAINSPDDNNNKYYSRPIFFIHWLNKNRNHQNSF